MKKTTFQTIGIICFTTLMAISLNLPATELESPNMLVPKTLYNGSYGTIQRFTNPVSIDKFDYPIFGRPHGIIAYKIAGGDVDTHEYLMITDPIFNRVIPADQLNNWVTSYGALGNGEEQFHIPHGIASWGAHSYYITDSYNNRVVRIDLQGTGDDPEDYYVNWAETYTRSNGYPSDTMLNMPMDVDIRILEGDPHNYIDLMAVADTRNNRLVFYRISTMHKFGGIAKYQSDDSGEPFYTPTSLCFGRNTNGWQNSYLWVVDNEDHKLKFYCVGYSSPGDSITLNGGGVYQFPEDSYLSCVEVDNKGLIYVLEKYSGKVYRFYRGAGGLRLIGVYGGLGTDDGELYYPNGIAVTHGINCNNYPDPCTPLTDLADAFITESWGEQTGIRRFTLGVDVLNLWAQYYPYRYSTGTGNYIEYEYHTTDYANVTNKIFDPQGTLVHSHTSPNLIPGLHGYAWAVEDNLNGNYTIQITAASTYSGSNTDIKEVIIYVNKADSTHDPVITEGPGLQGVTPGACLADGSIYIAYVKAFEPDDEPLTYIWQNYNLGYFPNGSYKDTTTTDTITLIIEIGPGSALYKSLDIPADLKVRVRDPLGGEAYAHQNYTVANTPEECCSGCPYIYVWSGSEFKKENTILAKSEDTLHFKKENADFCLLTLPLALTEENYKLQIKEFENEHSYIDYLSLVSIDYAANKKIGVASDGKFYFYSNPRPPISCIDNLGQDCLSKVLKEDTLYFESNYRGYLILNYGVLDDFKGFKKPLSEGGGGDPLPDPPKEDCYFNKPVPGPVVSQGNILTVEAFADNAWVPVNKLYPRARPGVTLVEFSDYIKPGEELKIKLSWEKGYKANQLAYYDFDSTGFVLNRIPLSSAYHSVEGEVTSMLAKDDNIFAELEPGEWIDLFFPYQPLNPEVKRGFALIARGYYQSQDIDFWSSDSIVLIPDDFSVSQNYPNPFNPQTEIKFSLPQPSQVKLEIFNVRGQKVKTLLNQDMVAGTHSVIWDGRNEDGKNVASGIYFYRLKAGEYRVTKKMLILK